MTRFSLLVLTVFWVLLLTVSTGMARDVSEYTVDASFFLDRDSIAAHTAAKFTNDAASTQTCFLHGEIRVDSILCDGTSIEFRQRAVYYYASYSLTAREVTFDRGNAPTATLYYSGYFHTSGSRSPSDYMRIEPNAVLLRGWGYSLWYPVFTPDSGDGYAIDRVTVSVTTSANLTSVVTGDLTGRKRNGDRVTSYWEARDIDVFTLQCTALPWDETTVGDVHLYSRSDMKDATALTAIQSFVTRLLDRYAACYRPAKSGQYHIMQMPRFGDIASGNAVGISDDVWSSFADATWARRVLGHELVHSFVQSDVPQSDPMFALTIEAFPAYYHLPILAETEGEDWYNEYMRDVYASYLNKRETGKGRRGRPLPIEKPIMELTADDVGRYKDNFVLGDRALLFGDWLRRRSGQNFYDMTRELFAERSLSKDRMFEIIEKYIPNSRDTVYLWLYTSDYPESLHLK